MKTYLMADPVRYARMTTEELRGTFLVDDLFQPGVIQCAYLDVDRTVVGSAVPVELPLKLETDDSLRAAYFLERRELGVLNIGGAGTVSVDGKSYALDAMDHLYVSRGSKDVVFASADASKPAEFYLLSYPAHAAYPTTLKKKADLQVVELGAPATANRRTLSKCIHPDGVKSCQLVMGFTQVHEGSVWNTMPPHTHMRRSEIYLYFGMAPESRVIHLMGPPQETRHLLIANKQVAISPSWSIHAGAGTGAYTFCWGMGGENQAFDDMDGVAIAALK
ncbi:MAG: 5-dehydro-4-deoxy-D-glucuronate isomerase [Acidobacteriaceae bacterium]